MLAHAIGSTADTGKRYAPAYGASRRRWWNATRRTAPRPVKNEAVIRCAGFLYGSRLRSGIASEGAADQTVTYAAHPA